MSIFEAGMMVCFGASWPIAAYKTYKAKCVDGKSLRFSSLILLGYVFARCYRSGVLRQSKAAIVMMPLLVTMIFYLPANNKVFVQPASMLLMVYLAGYEFLKSISKKRY